MEGIIPIGKTAALFLVLFLVTHAHSQNWQTSTVATGTKPQIDLDSGGNPHIVYIHQFATGWVRYAEWNPSTMSFDTTTVNDGNFEGPPAIALDQNDVPHLSYHRHTPPPEQLHAYFTGTIWMNEELTDPNHDGWDNSIAFDSNNMPHTSSVDPSNYPGSTGVEYAYYDGSSWHIEAIGSTLVNFFGGSSLAIDSQDNPHITYYDDITGDLMYAVKDGGIWTISTIETDGDAGRFSSLELNDLDQPQVSYYRHSSGNTGVVKFASWTGAAWDIAVVDTLDSVSVADARQITSLELDAQGVPHISYGDERVVRYAVRNGSTWEIETVIDVTTSSTILGQVASLGLGDNGQPHIAYYETGAIGTVKYATKPASAAQLAVAPLALDFGQVAIGTMDTLSVLVQNLGQMTLNVTDITVDEPSFTVLPPTSFSLTTLDTHRIYVEFTAPSPEGTYSGSMMFSSNDPLAPAASLTGEAVDVVHVASTASSPITYRLFQNSPNPFNPTTTFQFTIVNSQSINLRVYDPLGREIATLVNEKLAPGTYRREWDATGYPSGVYFYRLSTANFVQTRKLVLLR